MPLAGPTKYIGATMLDLLGSDSAGPVPRGLPVGTGELAMIDPSCHGDLTDTEWSLIEPLLSRLPIRMVDHDLRVVINGILFLMRSGSGLRAAPPWSTAESYYWRWQADGTWEKIMAMRRSAVGG